MSTLSIDGMLYHSDALDRRQLAKLGPTHTVTHLINRIRTEIDQGETHNIGLGDLPNDVGTVLMVSCSTGTINVTVTDGEDVPNASVYNGVKFLILMLGSTGISAVSIDGVVNDSVYDLFVGA